MADMEVRKFDAEVGKILQLMIHSLYTNKDIFLRELISNASDACDKLRYLALTDSALLKEDTELKVRVLFDSKDRTITISDNGIGMNRQDLIEHLGTIARSGTEGFLSKYTGDTQKDVQLIGQFGVGFYSAFMVAENVSVVSRKAGEDQAYSWSSAGTGEFEVGEVEGSVPRGTSIMLTLREEEDNYLDKFRLKHIISTYSDHIAIPIELVDEEGKIEIANSASALWTRPKSDILPEDYKHFYKHVAHSPDEPWMTLHNKNEGTLEYTNLLFIPSSKPFDLFHPDRKTRVKLYVKRVYITDEGVDLVPAYMRFLRGIVDSQDLPLNISRETLQANPVIEKIRRSLVKRVLSDLKKRAEKEPVNYLEFWENFGAVLKEGLCEGLEGREPLLEVCRFYSALQGRLISLDEYIATMKEGQTDIYYLTGESVEKLKVSPQLEGFVGRDIDVLLFTDTVDDFWVNVVADYKDKELKSVTRSEIDLDKIAAVPQTEDKKEEEKTNDKEVDALIAFIKATLAGQITDVRVSGKLTDSPVCLGVKEGAMDIRMERFLIDQKQLAARSAKVLEINPKHPIISNIAHKVSVEGDKEAVADIIRVLFDQACIMEGEPIADAGAFSRRLSGFLQKALVA